MTKATKIIAIDDIKALIASDASRTLELKKSTGELKDGMYAACAFLNTEESWLIFCLTPKSLKIVGQQVRDDTGIALFSSMITVSVRRLIFTIHISRPNTYIMLASISSNAAVLKLSKNYNNDN